MYSIYIYRVQGVGLAGDKRLRYMGTINTGVIFHIPIQNRH